MDQAMSNGNGLWIYPMDLIEEICSGKSYGTTPDFDTG